MTTRLFVYGTLRTGQAAHHLLAGQRFLGLARTRPLYRLLPETPYPALVPVPPDAAAAGEAVPGEVWEVDPQRLTQLDAWEEVPHLYQRRPIDLEGDWTDVQAYFWVLSDD